MRILFVLLTILALCPSMVMAQDTAPTEEERKIEAEKQKKADEESKALIVQLNESIKAISENLNDADKRHFFVMYSNHTIISTVQMVRSDVGDAVTSCGEKNPDIKDAISKRYKDWDQAVGNKVKDAQAYINNMIVAQDYTDKNKLRNIMDMADKLRTVTGNRVKKVPITTKESCEFLMKKMDETQEHMINLLEQSLLNAPAMLQTVPESTPAPAEDAPKN